MKKILASLLSVAMFALLVTPVLAVGHGCKGKKCPTGGDIKITTNNNATVSNNVDVKADTGNNEIKSKGTIVTGNAVAMADLVNVVNSNDVKVKTPCDCPGDITIKTNNDACVSNDVDVDADTGDNEIKGKKSKKSKGTIVTGNATSYANVMNLVNDNIIRVIRW